MKKILISILFIFMLNGCMSTYLIDSKTNKEYVLINELNLSKKDQLKLSFLTYSDSEFIHYDNRSQKTYYQVDYDYINYLKNY